MSSPAEVHAHFLNVAASFSPTLAAHLGQLEPLWLPERNASDLLAFLSRAIVGQQLSTSAARTIRSRLEALSQREGLALDALLVPAHVPAIRACGISEAKARALCSVNQAIRDGVLDEVALAALPSAERSVVLRSVWGVGPWTCDMASIFYFGDPDIWPGGDVSVTGTFRRYVRSSMTWGRTHERCVRRFAPYRSLLAMYMYRILDSGIR